MRYSVTKIIQLQEKCVTGKICRLVKGMSGPVQGSWNTILIIFSARGMTSFLQAHQVCQCTN